MVESEGEASSGDLIEGASHCHAAAVEHVGVDHGGLDVSVSEEVLDSADVVAVLQKVSGEGMAEGVAADAFGDVCAAGGEVDGLLEGAAAGVMAAADAGARVGGDVTRGEDELPDEFGCGARVLACEGVGEVDGSEAGGKILLVEGANEVDLACEGLDEALREDRDAISAGLCIAHEDLAQAEIDVLDAQADAFREAEAASVEELGHEAMGRREGVDEASDFGAAEDGGEAFGAAGANGVDGLIDGALEDVPEEEEECVECLVLGGGGDLALDGEVCEEGADVRGAEVSRVAAVMEEDEATDPTEVGDLGAEGVVFAAEDEAGLIEDARPKGVHSHPLVVDGPDRE
jgi:hypothetical protein